MSHADSTQREGLTRHGASTFVHRLEPRDDVAPRLRRARAGAGRARGNGGRGRHGALSPNQRAGLLTQPALLALGSFPMRTSPSHLGSNIARTFFCEVVPEKPPGVPPLSEPAGVTTRHALEDEVGELASCGACHNVIDPPGLAFEGFDAIGRARTIDNGAPVDTTNLMVILPPSGRRDQALVNGPIDLAALLALDPGTQTCMAQQWLTFALGRAIGPADDPSVKQAFAQFQAAGFNLKALITAVLTSDTFLTPN